MTQSIPASETRLFSIEEYAVYDDGSDQTYELFRGRLEPMPSPTSRHINICALLTHRLQRHVAALNLPLVIRSTAAIRTEEASARVPDVFVCSRELWDAVSARPKSSVLDFDQSPLLVIEVVSEDRRRDYIYKRAEYALIHVPEYWIVDPVRERVWVLVLAGNEEGYGQSEFTAGQMLRSAQFPELELAAGEVLSPPAVEDLIYQERQQFDQERQRADQEQQRADQEQQRADQEQQRADQERQRAERLARYLREQGLDPDNLP